MVYTSVVFVFLLLCCISALLSLQKFIYFPCNVEMILLCAVSIYGFTQDIGTDFRLKSVMLNGFGRIKFSITKQVIQPL